ncbi:MAG: hypothetical protein GF410_16480 [Chitinivibrionales bacterium]|nr:hypothetical protein [Chitinivibrionales bacterium]
MVERIVEEYDAKLDNKHRCVIRGIAAFNRYHVRVFNSGKIEMTPRVLASPEELSENARRMLYGSVRSLKKGEAGSAVDFGKYRKYLKEKD